MIKSVRVATGSMFASMFFLGIGVSIVGATAFRVGYSPGQIGYLLGAQNLGFGIAVLLGGAASDLYPKPRILTIGLVLLALAFATLYRSDSYALNLLIMVLMGAGMGGAEAVTDALLLDMHTKNESRYVVINHFFVSIGSAVIALYLMLLDLDWSGALFQVAATIGALALIAGFLRPPEQPRAVLKPADILATLRQDSSIVLLFVSGACAIGLGIGSTGIIASYLSELRGFTPGGAQLGLLLFLSGMAIGRIIFGLLVPHGRARGIVSVGFVAAGLLLSTLYLIALPVWAVYPLLLLSGMSVAPLLPLTIALAGLRFRHIAGTAMGVIKVAIPVGGILFPSLIGLVADTVSFSVALYAFPVIAIIGVVGTVMPERR
ncbi:MAG: MFS transporter [Spirochaetaceae bacterium]|nr:MAG: MFS transporter [Spirochaetaceae bacterium]